MDKNMDDAIKPKTAVEQNRIALLVKLTVAGNLVIVILQGDGNLPRQLPIVEVDGHVEVEALGRVESDDGVEEDVPQWELQLHVKQRLKVLWIQVYIWQFLLLSFSFEVVQVGEGSPGGRSRGVIRFRSGLYLQTPVHVVRVNVVGGTGGTQGRIAVLCVAH